MVADVSKKPEIVFHSKYMEEAMRYFAKSHSKLQILCRKLELTLNKNGTFIFFKNVKI